MNTMTRRTAQPFAPIRLIEPNFRGVRHLGIRIAVLTFALGTGLSPTWAQGLGVSLPATVASTTTQGGSPNFADTYVTPFVASQPGLVTTWKAQFTAGTIPPNSTAGGCAIPVGMQLKVMRKTSSTIVTVMAAGSVHNPLADLQARFMTSGCPSFMDASSASVIQYTDPGLLLLPGDIVGVTVMSNPSVGAYSLPLASGGNTRTRLQNVTVGGTIDLSDSFTGTLAGLVPDLQVTTETPVYVSTFGGRQILAVGSMTGTTKVIYTDTVSSPAFMPEGIVVGPDARIYICDSTSNRIWRIKQDGTQAEKIFDASTTTGCTNATGGAASCPTGSEGPSVGSDGALYFNTRDATHTGVWKIAGGIFGIGFGGSFPAPVQVLTAMQTGSTFGEGTAFDGSDNLLVVDRSLNRLEESSPPFTSVNPTFITGFNQPIGVTVNLAGDIFVANAGANNIIRSSGGVQNTYFSFGMSDHPFYLRAVPAGAIFVVTNDLTTGGSAKVWRTDPSSTMPGTGNATLLVNLATATVPGLASSQGVGLAVPATSSNSISMPLNPAGGVNVYNFGPYNYKPNYPANPNFAGVNLVVKATEITQADLDARTAGTGSAGVKIVPYGGAGGDGVLFTASCADTNNNPIPCPTGTYTYGVRTSYNSQVTTLNNPGFLKARPAGAIPWTTVDNIFTAFSATRLDPTVDGTTDDGFSDFVVVQGVTGTPPTITITTPPQDNSGTYLLNQSVLASYSCSGAVGVTVKCLGTVPLGSPIDTSSVGTKSFRVSTAVSSGPTAVKSDTYNVAFNTSGSCLLYDPTKAVKGGSVIPIKLQVCDANGIDLSNSSIGLHAVNVVKTSGTITTTGVVDAGSANPDSDFRFDSTLGPTGGYIFNLKTVDPSGAALTTGTYQLQFMIPGDPTTHVAPFQVL